jgi:hypothetical protein
MTSYKRSTATILVCLTLVSALAAIPAAADGFRLIGAGGCRTADGGAGKIDRHRNVSLEQCKVMCLGVDRCKAIEFNTKRGNCEVHYDNIVRSTGPGGDAVCFRPTY